MQAIVPICPLSNFAASKLPLFKLKGTILYISRSCGSDYLRLSVFTAGRVHFYPGREFHPRGLIPYTLDFWILDRWSGPRIAAAPHLLCNCLQLPRGTLIPDDNLVGGCSERTDLLSIPSLRARRGAREIIETHVQFAEWRRCRFHGATSQPERRLQTMAVVLRVQGAPVVGRPAAVVTTEEVVDTSCTQL